MAVQQDTVEYKDYKAFERDRPRRQAAGWRVVQIEDLPQRAGLKRIVALGGIGAMAWRPPHHVIVVWERDVSTAPPPPQPAWKPPEAPKTTFAGDGEKKFWDAVEQIEKLRELNREGALTDEEFTQKKNELLSRL